MGKKLGIIGCGNMAGAILSYILKTETLQREDVAVYDTNAKAKDKCLKLGVEITESVFSLCKMSDMLLLGVKPNVAAKVLGEAGSSMEGKALMSIAAGVPSAKLKEFARTSFLRVLRIMPNTPAMVGAGTMVLCNDSDFTPEERRQAELLMGAVGTVEWIDEKQMDAVTGLSGSGPAYIAMLIEALADGGLHEGLSRSQAMNLATQTVLGTAKMIQETGMHPGELKDMVCSPGGTAIEGVRALETGSFRNTAMSAVIAATEKAKKLI